MRLCFVFSRVPIRAWALGKSELWVTKSGPNPWSYFGCSSYRSRDISVLRLVWWRMEYFKAGHYIVFGIYFIRKEFSSLLDSTLPDFKKSNDLKLKIYFLEDVEDWGDDNWKTSFWLPRNVTVLFGYKFGNDLEKFGLVWNKFQSETFARAVKSEDHRRELIARQ